ncbi:hemagglutinin/amebocyte aggregation factor-like [Pocillopora verrucosa]|uniref:hemagglutinin/amebocyte aggregation factor-like n=1 Tax=Pocillopora verrucosa TaxID=203993 RepID=UPI0033427C59
MSTTIRISTFLAVFAIFFGQSMSCDSSLPSGKDWANDWDLPMNFECENGNAITSLYSFWLGCKNDRVWSLECGAVGKFNNEKKCSLTAEVNEWDGPLFKMCDGNGYVGGLSSVHDNGKEDRRFKVLCCKSPNHRTTDCYTQILNDFRAVIDYTVPEEHVIVGFYSYHRNDKEDRAWQARVCRVRKIR